MNSKIFIGIDVSKEKLDIAVKRASSEDVRLARRAQEAWTLENTAADCDDLVRRLASMNPYRIALEATGGYEQRAFRALRAAGLPAVIVAPASVRNFAKAMGRKAKTDRIDALAIAHFAEVRKPDVLPLASENQERIAGLRGLRTSLLKTRTQYNNRLENCNAEVRKYIEKLISGLNTQLLELDAKLADALAATPEEPPRPPW
jgi:transposase